MANYWESLQNSPSKLAHKALIAEGEISTVQTWSSHIKNLLQRLNLQQVGTGRKETLGNIVETKLKAWHQEHLNNILQDAKKP